jgi:outer membrane protein TolC
MLPPHRFFRRVRPRVLLAAFIVSLSGLANAQDTLSLDRCLLLAKSHHPGPRIAVNVARAAELSLSELQKTRLPQVSGTAGAIYTPVPSRVGYDPAITDGGQVAGQIVLHQSLYDGGMRSLESDQLQLDVERTARERELAEHDLVWTVKQTYAEVLRSRDEVALRRESLEQLSTYGALVRKMHTGGIVNYADVLKSEIQTTLASLALEKAQASFTSARYSLSALIGISVGPLSRFADPVEDVTVPPQDPALSSGTLEMSIARLLLARGELDIERVSHERFPVLSLVADAGYLSSGDNLRLSGADRLNAWGYSIGVGFEIPILNWGATGLRKEQRELAADDLRLRMELLRRSLEAEIPKTSLELTKARGRFATLRTTITQAEESYLLTKSRYAAGSGTAIEVLAAQQLLTDVRMDALQTTADIRILAARLDRLTVQEQRPGQP